MRLRVVGEQLAGGWIDHGGESLAVRVLWIQWVAYGVGNHVCAIEPYRPTLEATDVALQIDPPSPHDHRLRRRTAGRELDVERRVVAGSPGRVLSPSSDVTKSMNARTRAGTL